MIDDVMGFRSLPLDGKILRFVRGSKREILVSSYIYIYFSLFPRQRNQRGRKIKFWVDLARRKEETRGGRKRLEPLTNVSPDSRTMKESHHGRTISKYFF